MVKCNTCNDNGFIVYERTIAVPVCCGRCSPNGDCCGNPDPYPELIQEQEPCPSCYVPTQRQDNDILE
jgi:hypothetical protein